MLSFAKHLIAQGMPRFLLLLFCLLPVALQAQDTTRVERKNWVSRTEYGYNFFVGDGADSLQNNARDFGSIKFNEVYQRRYYLKTSPFYVAPGLAWGIFEWRFKDPLILEHDSRNKRLLVFEDPDTLNVYGKSKLQVMQLMVPVEVGVQSGRFNFAVGAHAGWLFASKHKRKFERDGSDIRVKTRGLDVLQLNQFHYGVQARIAYGQVGLYALYQLSNLFTDQGPEVNAVQVGITFSQPYDKGKKKRIWDRFGMPGRTKTT